MDLWRQYDCSCKVMILTVSRLHLLVGLLCRGGFIRSKTAPIFIRFIVIELTRAFVTGITLELDHIAPHVFSSTEKD